MKILFTGGGTGGHFYPIIAIVEEINSIVRESKLTGVSLYYMSPSPYNEGVLFDHGVKYIKNYAGKVRRYFSILNFFDLFKTGWGIVKSLWDVFLVYPDVVFGKGGYASFPTLLAAKILRIPVIIHESDARPGKVNSWAGKFAERIAISYPDSGEAFKGRESNVAFTGQPIRRDVAMPLTSNAHAFFNLTTEVPTILILGGSLGAKKINDCVLETLPELVKNYQVLIQTGKKNYEEFRQTANVILRDSMHSERLHIFEYLDELKLRSAAGAANLVVSRAGSTIFEIASWGLPSIIIPISEAVSHDQTKNAFAYARSGSATVIEEANLKGTILLAETNRILSNHEIYEKMRSSTKSFVRADAARKIAEEILKLALSHGKRG